MKKILTAGLATLTLLLTACADGNDETTATTTSETSATTTVETTSATQTAMEATSTPTVLTTTAPTPTSVIPETAQQQIEDAATVGRGPRPPLEEMTLLDGFGYVGIYMADNGRDHYLCDSRGTPSMDIMGDDGCSEPMEWSEIQVAFEESLLRSLETQ